MNRFTGFVCTMLVLCLMWAGACAELPMDSFAGGSVPSPEGYTKTGYTDSTIRVELRTEETVLYYEKLKLNTVYNIVEIWIESPSQLRTALVGDVRNPRESYINTVSDRVNAVVSIDGDYYPQRTGGLAIRQSQAIRKTDNSEYDLLIVDFNGDFHILPKETKKEQLAEYEGNIYQAFCFGPGLVIDGEIGPSANNSKYGGFKMDCYNPRTAIGQIDSLHYVIVQAEGRNGRSNGVSGKVLAEYMLSLGCKQAYNFDGGNSSMIYFNKEIYNLLPSGQQRKLYDIVYFASAEGAE